MGTREELWKYKKIREEEEGSPCPFTRRAGARRSTFPFRVVIGSLCQDKSKTLQSHDAVSHGDRKPDTRGLMALFGPIPVCGLQLYTVEATSAIQARQISN